MRSALGGLKNLWAGIVIAVLFPVLVCRIIGFAIGLMWTRRRTRSAFRRSLLRAGLTAEEAESLAGHHQARISFRELLRNRHRFGR
ncbi:hypothetical protein KAJ02_07355 [Candidatus Bipolaricaulota bacterium]|nr:hypothetical protein [Candidatus Bipolaricaulota bacterium]